MAIRLTRIYTRTGDNGTTCLSDFSRVSKTDPRVSAYAACEETNAAIGTVLTLPDVPPEVRKVLRTIQNQLFDVGADLSMPLADDPAHPAIRIDQSYIDQLENWCDDFTQKLEPLTSFVLPGGAPAAAHLHLARTVCRRAEIAGWSAIEAHTPESSVPADTQPPAITVLPVTYLNRLSDLIFILARICNLGADEPLWKPQRPADSTDIGNTSTNPNKIGP